MDARVNDIFGVGIKAFAVVNALFEVPTMGELLASSAEIRFLRHVVLPSSRESLSPHGSRKTTARFPGAALFRHGTG